MRDFFSEKQVLITGGARGLGLALFNQLAKRGAQLHLVDLHQESLLKAQELRPEVKTYCGDLTNQDFRKETAKQIKSSGGLSILINNAGTVFGGPFNEVSLENHLTSISVNLSAVVAWTHEFLPQLLDQKDSRIMNIASASALLGFPLAATYAASKWGVLGFSESLALELRGHPSKIKVSAACPSYIRTELFQGAKAPLFTKSLDPEVLASKIISQCERGRFLGVEPWPVRAVPFLKSVLPHTWWEALASYLGIHQGMQTWRSR
jgi:all-trans-retinol dehydrogenase (NAD+)